MALEVPPTLGCLIAKGSAAVYKCISIDTTCIAVSTCYGLYSEVAPASPQRIINPRCHIGCCGVSGPSSSPSPLDSSQPSSSLDSPAADWWPDPVISWPPVPGSGEGLWFLSEKEKITIWGLAALAGDRFFRSVFQPLAKSARALSGIVGVSDQSPSGLGSVGLEWAPSWVWAGAEELAERSCPARRTVLHQVASISARGVEDAHKRLRDARTWVVIKLLRCSQHHPSCTCDPMVIKDATRR